MPTYALLEQMGPTTIATSSLFLEQLTGPFFALGSAFFPPHTHPAPTFHT